jgi:RND family efflux transporter MFP subunit
LLGTACVGCQRLSHGAPEQNAAQAAAAAGPQAAAVSVVKPSRQTVRHLIERPGYNVAAFERTPLYAKLPGFVQKWNFDIGDRVRKGAVLAEIAIPEMDAEMKQKEAAVRQADAEIGQARAALVRARAECDRAKSQYERMVRVSQSGVLDKEQVEENRLGYEAAQAAVAKGQADVSVAEARLAVARSDRDRVQALLQYVRIVAPYDGVVTARNVNTGDFVQPAATSKGESLFVVEQVDPVRVFVNVPEQDATWVRDGDAAIVRVQGALGQPWREFRGRVTRTSGSLNPQNRTLRTEIDLPNKDGKLLPGAYASVSIVAEHPNAWALPAAAVVSQGDQSFAYRVESGQAVRTPLRTGLRGGGLVEVLQQQALAEGSKEGAWSDVTGDETFAANAVNLSDGQAVTPQ